MLTQRACIGSGEKTFYSAPNYSAEARDAIWRRSGVILTLRLSQSLVSRRFSRVNNVRNACKRQRYNQNCWLNFLYAVAERWKNLKDTITF